MKAHPLRFLVQWLDSYAGDMPSDPASDRKIDWARILPFLLIHAACLLVVVAGFSWTALAVAAALYLTRMFAITAFYHRYFSHRAFRTSRVVQFLMGAIAASSAQRGPLWWAGHHRHHHAYADRPEDRHSPSQDGFLWAHTVWFLTRLNFRTPIHLVRDWARFPELRWLDRFDGVPFLVLCASLYGLGEALAAWAPGLGTSGFQLLVWGGFVSTVVLYHASFSVNSLAHRFGRRRYATTDTSRNNPWLAILTLGEGWHNNHHRYPAAARQGFFWWEVDATWYVLKALSWVGIVWKLKPVPAWARGKA